MKYDVLIFGSEALRRRSVPVKKVDASIKHLAKDMLLTMYEAHGLGLAAEQVGRDEAICVIDVPSDADVREKGGPRENPHMIMPWILINPRIVAESGEQSGQEGCLSFPEMFITVKRPYEVTVIFTSLEGKEKKETVRGLMARAVLHETDHLAGVLLVDHMSPVQKLTMGSRLRKFKKAARELEKSKVTGSAAAKPKAKK